MTKPSYPTNIDQSSQEQESYMFYSVSLKKFVIMCLATWGIYEIYWFYKNWDFIKRRHNLHITPFVRALFSIFFCYGLGKTINAYADEYAIPIKYSAGHLALTYVAFILFAYFPEPFWLMCQLAFIPLIPLVSLINNINSKLNCVQHVDYELTPWNGLIVTMGSFFWFIILFSTFK